MTADKFDEQNELFARLGHNEEASKIRAEMQGAGLLSDMQGSDWRRVAPFRCTVVIIVRCLTL